MRAWIARPPPIRFPGVRRLLVAVLAAAAAAGPSPAVAEVGTKVDVPDLPSLAGGKVALLAPGAKANVLVFFRTDQERSVDALRQLAACEKELARGVHWVAVVSGSASVADVKAVVAAAGIRMPVVLDAGDRLYDRLGIRLYPAVAVADAAGVVQAFEPYRQIDFSDAVKAQVRFVMGEIDQAARDGALDPEASRLPGQDDPAKKAMRDVNMARRLVELGQYDAAVKQAQRALEQAPVPAAFPVLAMAYARLGRCAEAGKMADQAQKLALDGADVASARALCAGK